MDTRFLSHNIQQKDALHFAELDPYLCQLEKLTYVYSSPLLSQLPSNISGIYTLTGGVQTGKTTLLKQWIARLIAEGISGNAITFLPGELIQDDHNLTHLLQTELSHKRESGKQYILIDDVTDIANWHRAIKLIADTDLLNHVILLLTS